MPRLSALPARPALAGAALVIGVLQMGGPAQACDAYWTWQQVHRPSTSTYRMVKVKRYKCPQSTSGPQATTKKPPKFRNRIRRTKRK